MPVKIIQLNFRYSFSGGEYAKEIEPLAKEIEGLPGMRGSLWMINEATSTAGGIYLFDDQASIDNFMNGPVAAQLSSYPSFSDFRVKQFDLMDNLTVLTAEAVKKVISA
jgi:hypothetical protein